MFSFLSLIFWFAVFCGGSYKLYTSIKAKNINMDLTKDKVDKLTEQSPILWGLTTLEHLNNKSNASEIGLYVFIAVIGAWGIGSQLLWSLIFFASIIGGVIFTLHLSAVMKDMGYKFFKFDKKFSNAQIPFFICIILFFCIPNFFLSPSAESAISPEKIQDIKSINKKLYKMQSKYYAHWKTFDDEASRNEKEKYNNKKTELYNAKEEYIKSLQGLTFKGKCYVDRISYDKSQDRFSKIITDNLSPLSEKQEAEQYPKWNISCRQRVKNSNDGFFQDTQGSKYDFFVSDIWLTEKEIDLLNNLREGDPFNFTGTAESLIDNELLTIADPNEYGLDIKFRNQVWRDADNKETEKTIFFD